MWSLYDGHGKMWTILINSQWANLYFGWWWPNWSQEKQFLHNLTYLLKVPKLTSSLVLCLCQQTSSWWSCISHVKAFSDVILCPTKINTPRTTINMTPQLENLYRITHFISRAFKINALHSRKRRSHMSEFKINCDFKRFIKVLSKSSNRTWMWTWTSLSNELRIVAISYNETITKLCIENKSNLIICIYFLKYATAHSKGFRQIS